MLLSHNALNVSSTSFGSSSTSKIFPFWLIVFLSGYIRQRKIKRRAAVQDAFRPDSPAVPGDDALHPRQANAGAFELLRAMQPLKHAEEFVGVLHVESDAVVTHETDYRPSRFDKTPDLDLRLRARPRVFQRVRE